MLSVRPQSTWMGHQSIIVYNSPTCTHSFTFMCFWNWNKRKPDIPEESYRDKARSFKTLKSLKLWAGNATCCTTFSWLQHVPVGNVSLSWQTLLHFICTKEMYTQLLQQQKKNSAIKDLRGLKAEQEICIQMRIFLVV